MTAQRFVFLEITDPEIGPLLQRMQWILSGVEPRHPVHLTLRGPYRREVPPKVLQKLRTTLRGEVLHIGGVGRFTNRHEEVVFLDVDSPSLRTVWWKRDYPIKAHGYRPHISLYRGRDSVFARGVTDFLVREALDLHCADYRLIVHCRGTLPLQDPTRAFSGAESRGGSGRFDPRLTERLGRFVDEYRSTSDERDDDAPFSRPMEAGASAGLSTTPSLETSEANGGQ